MRFIAVALSLFVFVSLARADFSVSCSNLYPEASSPEHTTAIAEVTHDATTGEINGLRCSVVPGDPADVCQIADGACCPCNTILNACSPECSVTVSYTTAETSGNCLEDYPENYCSSVTGAFVAAPSATTRHTKHRKHRHR